MNLSATIRNVTLSAILGISLIYASCNKNPKGTFMVKGQLFDSCGGSPISNLPLVVYYSSQSGFTPKVADSIGYGQTDGSGNFSIQCHNQGSGFIDIYTPTTFSGHRYVKEYKVEKPENKTFELKELYDWATFYGAANYVIAADFGPMDTLYIAGTPINPIPKGEFKQYYEVQSYTGNLTQGLGHYVWTIGKKGEKHNFTVEFTPCSLEKTSEVVISGK